MTTRLSKADARRLGLPVKKPATKKERQPPAPYHSRCVTCDTQFNSCAAEDRHESETNHARYDTM